MLIVYSTPVTLSASYVWDQVTQRLERRALNQEYLGSNPLAAVSKLWQFRSPRCHWLNASQRSRNGVGMNRSASGLRVKRFEQSQGLDSALYENIPFT